MDHECETHKFMTIVESVKCHPSRGETGHKGLSSFPSSRSGKEAACQCRRRKRYRFNPWVGKIPWRRGWQPTPIFLPGESHGAWWATVHGVARVRHDLVTKPPQGINICYVHHNRGREAFRFKTWLHRVWAMNCQHWHHLGTCWKCRVSGPTLDLLYRNLQFSKSPWGF